MNYGELSQLINIKKHNNSLHADCHKRHRFCEEKEPQKMRPLCQPVKLALSEPFRYRSRVLITRRCQETCRTSCYQDSSALLQSLITRRSTGSLALIIVAVAAIISAKLPVNDALCKSQCSEYENKLF